MTVTPQVRKLETSANFGKFDIEPLDPGFGTTLGNTLRRVLLSSLWGAAVTSIQIDGVAHEFTAIPHVKEDVTEVILNLKKLCLKSFTEDPITLLLDVKGPTEVRASHIQATSDVEIVNPGSISARSPPRATCAWSSTSSAARATSRRSATSARASPSASSRSTRSSRLSRRRTSPWRRRVSASRPTSTA